MFFRKERKDVFADRCVLVESWCFSFPVRLREPRGPLCAGAAADAAFLKPHTLWVEWRTVLTEVRTCPAFSCSLENYLVESLFSVQVFIAETL